MAHIMGKGSADERTVSFRLPLKLVEGENTHWERSLRVHSQ